MKEQSVESWNQEGSVKDLLETFAEFPEWVKTTLSRTETVGLWQLRDQVGFLLCDVSEDVLKQLHRTLCRHGKADFRKGNEIMHSIFRT